MENHVPFLQPGKVGVLSKAVIVSLGLSIRPGRAILLGETNIAHMQARHPADFARYAAFLPEIIASPDYIGQNPKDQSIEFVKEFVSYEEYVKVAVRVSTNGNLYARSLYVLNRQRVNNFISNGTLKKPLTFPLE